MIFQVKKLHFRFKFWQLAFISSDSHCCTYDLNWRVQIAGSDDSYLCIDSLTLAAALEEDHKKMMRKQ
jgi:hypothetical protein